MFTSVSLESPKQIITASLLQDGSSHVQPGRNTYLMVPCAEFGGICLHSQHWRNESREDCTEASLGYRMRQLYR